MKEDSGARADLNRRTRVLFLCTGNSARSQIGEALLRHLGGPDFEVFSAGSHPRPSIHPMAREAVRELYGLSMEGQHPKGADRVPESFDWIISVCDRAADSCPLPPAAEEVIRWSLEDPAEVGGDIEEQREAFRKTSRDLHGRIEAWLGSPEILRVRTRTENHEA